MAKQGTGFVGLSFHIGLVLLCCSCGKPKSVPSTINTADSQAMKAAYDRLEKTLSTQATGIYTNLSPPATENEIATLRAALNGNTVEALETWYRWHNGTTGQLTDLLPLGHPLSIAEALEDRRMMQSVPFVDQLRKNAIKLMDDGAGDGFFLDVTSTNPTVFYHMLEDPFPRSYGTMTEFIDFIASGFEQGVLFVDKAGNFAYDDARYKSLEEAHFGKIKKQ
jgi:hypothetical protein